MRIFACSIVCLLIGTSAALAVGPGTIETGVGGMAHLSPEPWQISGRVHVVYFLMPIAGIGPYFNFTKCGDYEYEWAGETFTEKSATHFGLGALAKLYLPVAMMGGKLTPFVEGGLGMRTVTTGWEVTDATDEEETELKMEVTARVGADYWIAPNWTIWFAFHGQKIFADEEDIFYEDEADFQAELRLGVATFLGM